MIKQKFEFTFAQICKILSSVACALAFLHSYLIIHRDIKSSNIFIVQDINNEIVNVVIGSLDNSIQLESPNSYTCDAVSPIHSFLCPEIIKGLAYNFSSDGLFLFILCFSNGPVNIYSFIANSLQYWHVML